MSITDQLYMADPRHTVQAAYGALSALQDLRPGTQVAAAAVLFFILADELKLDISQLISTASKIAKDDDTFFRREVKAFRAYVQGELK